MDNFRLALITGASSGLGRELSRQLAQQKIPLLLTGRDREALQEIVQECSPFTKTSSIRADLLEKKERHNLVSKIHKEVPDLIINCAGAGIYGNILETETEKQLSLLDLNARTAIEISIESARTLYSRKLPGVILNVSSVAGFYLFPTLTMYASAKACLTLFSQSFDREMEPYGIRILASCPGQIETSFVERAGGKKGYSRSWTMSKEYAAKRILRQIAMRKALDVFDWRYKLSLFLTHFVPKRVLAKRLASEIEERYQPKGFIS